MLFNHKKHDEETSGNDMLAASLRLLRAFPTQRGYQPVWLVSEHEIEANASVGGKARGARGEASGGNKLWRIGGPWGSLNFAS